MSRAAALVAQILEAPEDDAARLVLADWLEEQGSPRAELIRLQLRRAVSDDLAARCATELTRLAAWLPEPVFERGLVRLLQLAAGTYANAGTQDPSQSSNRHGAEDAKELLAPPGVLAVRLSGTDLRRHGSAKPNGTAASAPARR